MSMLDLEKWSEKVFSEMRAVCETKQAPCVAFCLLFFDPMAQDDKNWNYSIHLIEDPETETPNPDEKKRITLAFEYIMEGVKRIMSVDDIGTFH